MGLKKNKFWEWEAYSKSLYLRPPFSYLAVFVALGSVLSIVYGLVSQFLG